MLTRRVSSRSSGVCGLRWVTICLDSTQELTLPYQGFLGTAKKAWSVNGITKLKLHSDSWLTQFLTLLNKSRWTLFLAGITRLRSPLNKIFLLSETFRCTKIFSAVLTTWALESQLGTWKDLRLWKTLIWSRGFSHLGRQHLIFLWSAYKTWLVSVQLITWRLQNLPWGNGMTQSNSVFKHALLRTNINS